MCNIGALTTNFEQKHKILMAETNHHGAIDDLALER
jgi:hypothetical protein